jgi:uncharacterized protein (DUF885 family)
MIRDRLVPAYRRLRTFVHDEYLPRTRTSVAWTALPDGEAWYTFFVAEHTTTAMTPEEIHELGLREVTRILGEMNKVRQRVGFQGDLPAFFTYLRSDPKFYYTSGTEVIAAYLDVKKRIDAALPKLFSVFPKADYEVREVEAFRAKSAAGAYYQAASAATTRPMSKAGRCTRSFSDRSWDSSPIRTRLSAGSTTSSCARCGWSSTRVCTRRHGPASRRSST